MLQRGVLILITLVLSAGLSAVAQSPAVYRADRRNANWIFGNSPGFIRFNRVTAVPERLTGKALPFGTGGSVSVSDPVSGDLLFYSDGSKVYDRSHLVMPQGTGISGSTSINHQVLSCAVPGQNGKYLLFTNSATNLSAGAVFFTVVDMNQFGNSTAPAPATGDIDVSMKNIPVTGLSGVSEAMILIPKADGQGCWLITHLQSSGIIQVTDISASAFQTGIFTTAPYSVALGISSASQMSWHPLTGKLALMPASPGQNGIILTVDQSTGIITFDQSIPNSAVSSTNGQSVFDAEWSPEGRFLYLSVHGDETQSIRGNVFQFDPSKPEVLLASVLPADVFRSFGLQRANDTTVYHLYQSSPGGIIQLGQLDQMDTVASAVIYRMVPLGPSDWQGMQFPSRVPLTDPGLSVSFNFAGACQRNPVVFFPVVTPGADSLRWEFGDGSTSGDWSPRHQYGDGTSFTATLSAFLDGFAVDASQAINLQTFNLTIQVTSDTTACRSEFPPTRGSSSPTRFEVEAKVEGGTPASALWSNGNTGLILKPDSAGYYYLVITDIGGCSAYAGVNVKEYGLQDQRSNLWYFGNKAGIDFNEQPPLALGDGAMNAPEGCAVVSDRNGKLIFYTDGDKVYNKEHMEIASGIGGNPASTQSAIIMPIPGDETLYYIFTTEANILGSGYTLYYSLFDLKQNNGLGAVTSQKNLLFTRSTERMTANDNWLVAHEFGNNSFRAYRITASGISDPVISAVGSEHTLTIPTYAEGYMRLGPRGNLAVPLANPGTENILELFHLVDSTGLVTDYRRIDLKTPAGQVYGVEFSPAGNKLFATITGPPSQVVEYFLDSLDRPFFRQRVNGPGKLGAIQRAPDGQLYIAQEGSSVLGLIQVSEDTTQVSAFNFAGFPLAAGTTSRLGLPNFIFQTGNAFGGPSLAFDGICLGTPTLFAGAKTDPIDNFIWAFGDGAGSTEDTIRHLYASPSSYTVSLNVKNRCGLDTTLVQVVKVVPPPDLPTIPAAIPICSDPIVLDANTANKPGLSYAWTTGDTTRQITTNIQGAFGVVVEDKESGCTSAGISLVVDNRPVFDLGPDINVCQNQSVPGLDAQNPGANFLWTLNNNPLSTAQRVAVSSAAAGEFEYQVTVTDPVTSCFRKDSVLFVVRESPVFNLAAQNSDANCTSDSGKIDIQIAASAATFSYNLTGPLIRGGSGKVSGTYSEGTLPAGAYVVSVLNEISGCALGKTTGITETSFTVSVNNITSCSGDPLTLNTTAPGTYTVNVTGAGGFTAGPVTRSGSPAQTPSVPPGTYTVEVNAGGCKVTATNVQVVRSGPVPVSAALSDRCAASPLLSASTSAAGASYSWEGPSGTIVAPSAFETRINPAFGTSLYKVTVSAPGFCPAKDSVTVNFENLAGKVAIQSSDVCQNTVIWTADAPAGPYTYRWYRNNVLDLSLLGSQIGLDQSQNGQVLRVELFSSASGCGYPSQDKTVEVVGPVTASLTGEQACNDNKLVTLTSATNLTSGATYAWFFNGTSIPGSADTVRRRPEGVYRVEVSKATCRAGAELELVRAPIPVGKLPSGVVICSEPLNPVEETKRVRLDPGKFVSYLWFKNDIQQSSSDQVFVAESPGLYRVDLTNSFNCKASDETEVINDCIPIIVTPNAFRPESNLTENKDFFAFSLFIEENFRVYIYNRWGELIYQSSDKDFRWNGGYQNDASRPAPSGTYAWIMEYVSAFRPDAGFQTRRGGVMLIR